MSKWQGCYIIQKMKMNDANLFITIRANWWFAFILLGCLCSQHDALAIGQPQYVRSIAESGSFPIVQGNRTAGIHVDAADWPGVIRAAKDLQSDIARVTDRMPAISSDSARLAGKAVIIGTIGKSRIIDSLVQAGKIDIRPVAGVPQLWCLYKEVQEYYAAGLRVPDDVTLLWADDNWGNIRRLPTESERGRAGGAGIYYHFDYVGGPRNYKWINTVSLPTVWEQMTLAKEYGADRIWIVNVGHFKHVLFPTEFFLRLAWNTGRWTNRNIGEYTRLWAAREFGPKYAEAIADIIEKYTKHNARRKPELIEPP